MKVELDRVREIVNQCILANIDYKGSLAFHDHIKRELDKLEAEESELTPTLGAHGTIPHDHVWEKCKSVEGFESCVRCGLTRQDQPKPKMFLHWYIDINCEIHCFRSMSENKSMLLPDCKGWEHIKTEAWND